MKGRNGYRRRQEVGKLGVMRGGGERMRKRGRGGEGVGARGLGGIVGWDGGTSARPMSAIQVG